MLRVLKRIKNKYENNPTILDDLEPEVCLFIYLFQIIHVTAHPHF